MTQLPLVFATVGTDHHPFDRLVRWVDAWDAARGGTARCVVQGGTSPRSGRAEWHEYLPYEEMVATMGAAVAVVSHGGPATIMDCRQAGVLPIVVPRRKEFGEHVDDHQVRFATRMAEHGQIVLAENEAQLHSRLDEALGDPDRFRLTEDSDEIALAVERVEELVGRMLARPARRARRRSGAPR